MGDRGLLDHVERVGRLDGELVVARRQVLVRWPETHGSKSRPSSEQANVTSGWFASNVKVAVRSAVVDSGAESSVVVGGPITVHVYDAGRRVRVRRLGEVDRAHEQRVLAGLEPGQVVRRLAAVEVGAVERALERRVRLVGGEREDRGRVGQDLGGRAGHDRRLGRRRVDDRPLVTAGSAVDEQERLGRLDRERVGQARARGPS